MQEKVLQDENAKLLQKVKKFVDSLKSSIEVGKMKCEYDLKYDSGKVREEMEE